MSEENVEIARRLYPGRVNLAATLANPEALGAVRAGFEPLVDPDFETVADPRYQLLLGDPGHAAAGSSRLSTFFGIDGLVSAFRDWFSEWESWEVTPTDFIEVDENRVFVGIEMCGRSKAQQIEMSSKGGNLLTFDDARLTRIELFLRRADALEAAGLSE